MVSEMHIAGEGLQCLTRFDHSLGSAIRTALLPLLRNLPAVTLALRWDETCRAWVSTLVKRCV